MFCSVFDGRFGMSFRMCPVSFGFVALCLRPWQDPWPYWADLAGPQCDVPQCGLPSAEASKCGGGVMIGSSTSSSEK
jgi:hypothetical protein